MNEDRTLLVKMRFGSHLYGTATSTSDTDYKGVFIPSRSEILLGRIPKSLNEQTKRGADTKNTADDVDTELYSLHYFLHLALQGETVALDMLHADDRVWVEPPHPAWLDLLAQRSAFYTKNLRALVGYARRQAAKYGIKGSRLSDAQRVLTYLQEEETKSPGIRLEDIWDGLPAGEHLRIEQDRTYPETIAIYNVCGKQLQSTARVSIYIESLARFVDNYGERARQARENQNIDWKAVSHAFRAAYQVRAILLDGGFTYPLPQTDFILDVKRGLLDYTTVVAPGLDAVMDEIEALSAASALPERADSKRWDAWLLSVLDAPRPPRAARPEEAP